VYKIEVWEDSQVDVKFAHNIMSHRVKSRYLSSITLLHCCHKLCCL